MTTGPMKTEWYDQDHTVAIRLFSPFYSDIALREETLQSDSKKKDYSKRRVEDGVSSPLVLLGKLGLVGWQAELESVNEEAFFVSFSTVPPCLYCTVQLQNQKKSARHEIAKNIVGNHIFPHSAQTREEMKISDSRCQHVIVGKKAKIPRTASRFPLFKSLINGYINGSHGSLCSLRRYCR
jgi:hypothetical protein